MSRLPNDGGGLPDIGSRVMDVDDVRDIVSYVHGVAQAADTSSSTALELASGRRSTTELENLSDWEWARATIRVSGSRSFSLTVSLHREYAGVDDLSESELNRPLREFILGHSKAWYNARHVLAVAAPLIVLATSVLVVWYAIDVRLDARLWVPVTFGMSVFSVATLRFSKSLDAKLASTRAGVKINGESRSTFRERRWNQRRDIWVGSGSLAAGVLLGWLGLG